MASDTSTSSTSSSSSSSATNPNTLASQSSSTQQDPWAPGASDRSLRHQRDSGFVYNEDHEESLFNDPADIPSQIELADELHTRLREVEEEEEDNPRWRDRFWQEVAKGDYLLRWVRYTRVELREMREELEAGREQVGEDDGEGDGFETAAVTGGGVNEVEDEEQEKEDEEGSDGGPNWTSLETEMEAADFE